MKYILIIAAVLLLHTELHAREIALTFDDCPRKSGPIFKPMERAKKLVATLKKEGITAAFFCNSPSRDVKGSERLQFFASHGHIIANHSANHPDLNKASVDQFIMNIDQADAELKSFSNFRKWFRFPYLHEGKTAQDVESVRSHLKKIGYLNGYVTIDSQDWYVDDLLREKILLKKRFNKNRLCQSYSRIISDDAQFFDNMSIGALGRSPKHVILMHETDLNALCLGHLVKELRKGNWSIISPDIAYQDPIAFTEPSASTQLSQGRVFALAKEAGYKGPWYSNWNEESEIEKELEKQGAWE